MNQRITWNAVSHREYFVTVKLTGCFCLQNLQEDVNRLQQRVKELESSNSSLSSLLLQRMHRNQSHSNSNSSTFHSNNSGNRCCQTFACLQSSLDVFAKVGTIIRFVEKNNSNSIMIGYLVTESRSTTTSEFGRKTTPTCLG